MRLRLRHDRLRELVARSHISQNHWALRLGLSRGHWSGIVNGKHPYPSPRTRQRLLEVFQVSLEELFETETGTAAWSESDFRSIMNERYVIDAEIGQGGMGVVYRARDLHLGRPVAIKVVSPEAVSGIGSEQFIKEISSVSHLQHPNILPLLDAGQLAGHVFYVMPYVRGGSLRDRLETRGRLALTETLAIVNDVARALDHAHRSGILHCDVKPANILLDDGHAYLMDFGIARAIHREVDEWGLRPENTLDVSAGTPAYVSPEQANRDRDLDPRSDVYSLACVVFEMLAGQPPFEGRTTEAIVARRFIGPPPRLRDFAPEVPAGVAAAIERAMAMDRDGRPATPVTFFGELDRGYRRMGSGIRPAARQAWAGIRRRTGLLPSQRLGRLVSGVARDLRFALRGLRRQPGFAVATVVTFALGIGANATMFGVIDRLLVRGPAHVVEPDKILRLRAIKAPEAGRAEQSNSLFPYPTFEALRRGLESVASVGMFAAPDRFPLGRGATAQVVEGQLVSAGYFEVLGVQPALGRYFTDAEDKLPLGEPVAVIGFSMWRRYFGGDRSVLGRTLELGLRRYAIIGIAPRGFTGTGLGAIDVWLPVTAAEGLRFVKQPSWATDIRSQWVTIIARPRAGVAPEQVAARATPINQAEGEPWSRTGVVRIAPVPLQPPLIGRRLTGRTAVAALLAGVSVLVLVIACANVANLLLMRAIRRRREIALRVALGISRRRLMGQLVAESLLLAGAGGAAALLVAHWGGTVLRTLLFNDVAWTESPWDGRLIAYTGIVALATGLFAGLVPAVQSSHPDLTKELRSGGREGSGERTRTRTTLLVVQATLSVVLLVGAGLFVRSLHRVTALDLGFEPDRVLVGLMDIDRMGRSTGEVDALFRRMEERVRKIPNVQAVAAAVTVPSYWNYGARIAIPGIPSVLVPEGGVYRNAVRPDYFTAMGIRILQGRGFTEADERPGAAVAIINETMARRVWPAGQPLGSCVRFVERPAAEPSGPVAEAPCAEIIGVAEDSRHGNWVEDEIFHVHLPLAQAPSRMAQRVLVVRPAGRDPAGLIEPVRREMQGLAPDLPYAEVEVLAARFADELRPWRLGAAMFGVLGLLAIVLAVVGLYAVVSFSVVGRTHEIGVRMAIGAGRGAVVALVLRQGLTIAVTGIAIGLGIAVLAGRFIASLLYETSPRDPVVLGGVAGFLILAAVAASLIPSWRAARIDPAIALRSD